MPLPPSTSARFSEIRPPWAIDGGRITILGLGFPIDAPLLPVVRVGTLEARVVYASASELAVIVPSGVEGGQTPVRVDGAYGEHVTVELGTVWATDLHLVDNPLFDRQGRLYATFSGTRGQKVETPLFRIGPDREREALPAEILNATSMAVDLEGRVYVSSRFEGTVHRLREDGTAEVFASDLGVPCGLTFGPDGQLYVGDRSGSILNISGDRQVRVLASLPPSVAAYHLAFGPDGCLYVTAPTLSSSEGVYRVGPDGCVSVISTGFGRPQGLAFDHLGRLYVVEALAGSSGLYRVDLDRPDAPAEHVLAGSRLIGLAFDPAGGLVVASTDTIYRLDVALRPLDVRG